MRHLPPAVLVLVLAACGDDRPGKAPDPAGKAAESGAPAAGGPPAAPRRPEAAAAPATAPKAGIRFTDVSAESGIVLENVSGDPVRKMAIPENIGQGAAVFDYDGDGKLDVFVANGDVFEGMQPRAEPRCALYRNVTGWTFEDVTQAAGLVFKGWCHGAHAVDFDADGHTDLYVTCFLRPNVFFRNRGDGTFEDMTAAWGGADPGPSTCAAFFDADQDGDLDLYVGNYVAYDPKDPPNGGQPCEWKGLKVSCGPLGTPAVPATFWENRDGRLVDATAGSGFAQPGNYALGCVAADYDNDGDTDLYVANDSRPNYFFEQHEKGRFREIALLTGVAMNEDARVQSSMGIDAGDVDNDGRLDIFTTNFSHDSNTLYRNESAPGGPINFIDTTFVMRLGEASYAYLSWGTRILDLDCDGWQDIVVASGHVYPQVDGANLGTSYAQHTQVFRNLGPAGPDRAIVFEELKPVLKKTASRGLAAADFDDDGDLDLLITILDGKPMLLRNDTADRGHWIGFLLRGAGRNREAVGASVEVAAADGTTRVRQRTFGAGFLSTSDRRLHFGLGAGGGPAKRVTVRWPGGATHTHEGLAAGRYWILDAATGKAEAAR